MGWEQPHRLGHPQGPDLDWAEHREIGDGVCPLGSMLPGVEAQLSGSNHNQVLPPASQQTILPQTLRSITQSLTLTPQHFL